MEHDPRGVRTMYDKETRERALALVASGLSPRAASRAMGGRPCATCIVKWLAGEVPGSRRSRPRLRWSSQDKLAAVRRVLAGERYREVAGDVGCAPTTVLGWRKAFLERGEAAFVTADDVRARTAMRGPGGLPDDPDELKAMVVELQFQVDLRDELLEIVKKDPGADPSALSSRERAELVGALRPAYSLAFLMPRVGIAESTYHYQRARIEAAADPDADIRAEVARLFEESGGTWGYRRVKAEMDARGGELAHKSEKRILRVMRQEGLEVAYDRKRRRRYDSYDRAADEADAGDVPNVPLLPDGTHDFTAPAPNVLWVTDVTEFALPDDPRKVYLSPVLDCFDGSLPGWEAALSASSEALTDPSLEMACAQLREGDAPACHSDRGSQYHAASWIRACEEHGVTRSMSRKGRSPDNARMEGFFGTLKNERFYWRDWSGWTAEQFVEEVDRWMVEHNESRRKLSLGWKTPMEYRRAALAGAA